MVSSYVINGCFLILLLLVFLGRITGRISLGWFDLSFPWYVDSVSPLALSVMGTFGLVLPITLVGIREAHRYKTDHYAFQARKEVVCSAIEENTTQAFEELGVEDIAHHLSVKKRVVGAIAEELECYRVEIKKNALGESAEDLEHHKLVSMGFVVVSIALIVVVSFNILIYL